MADIAIRAEGLGKAYLISHGGGPRYQTLRESLVGAVQRPFRRSRTDLHETIWALRDVNLEVHRGDALGIIGRNGAGKSTLLKILSRITPPTSGRAELIGRLGSLLEVGTGFHPELTGRENVFLNGAILGMRRQEIRRHFDEIVAFAETERFLDTPVKRYSTGMYMRLAFAVAAHLETDILLVDEVLAVGDAAFQVKCLGKMGEVAGQGRTVLFVSHNMAAVRTLCSAAIVLEEGRSSGVEPINHAIRRYSAAPERVPVTAVDRGDIVFSGFELSQAGADRLEYDGGAAIDVRLRFQVRRNLRDFRVGLIVRTEQGDLIARCLLADWDRSRVDIEKGDYCLEGSIPPGFFTGGRYFLAPHASVFDLHDYRVEEAFGRTLLILSPASFNQGYPREQSREHVGIVTLDVDWRLTGG